MISFSPSQIVQVKLRIRRRWSLKFQTLTPRGSGKIAVGTGVTHSYPPTSSVFSQFVYTKHLVYRTTGNLLVNSPPPPTFGCFTPGIVYSFPPFSSPFYVGLTWLRIISTITTLSITHSNSSTNTIITGHTPINRKRYSFFFINNITIVFCKSHQFKKKLTVLFCKVRRIWNYYHTIFIKRNNKMFIEVEGVLLLSLWLRKKREVKNLVHFI